jgi:hypothetical protein
VRQKTFNVVTRLLIAIPLLTLGFACSRSNQPSQTKDIKASPAEKYMAELGTFQSLQGTPYLMATVNGIDSRSDKLSTSGTYWTSNQTHNLVFLDANSLVSQRLFDTNAYVILQTERYAQKEQGKAVTRWLAHQVVKNDSDGNQRLDGNDQISIGISSASGKGYVEVLAGITEIYGLTMVNPGKLVVVYGKEGAKSSSIVDLDKRNILTTRSIVDLGSEVK